MWRSGFLRAGSVLAFFVLTQSCRSQAGPEANPYAGKWTIAFNSKDIGLARSFLTFEFKDSSFTAYTRRNAAKDIVGSWKSLLGRLFTRSFERGSLINITHGKTRQRADTLVLSGIFRSALGSYYFKGTIYKGILEARLLNGRKELRGTITGSMDAPSQPLTNYPQLTGELLVLTREKIYNRQVLETDQWSTFEKEIKRVSEKMQDDIEMEFAFFYYAEKLPFSHYALLRPAPGNPTDPVTPTKQVTLEEKSPGTLYMKIASFGGTAQEMDSAFAYVLKKDYKNLVVDLRGNPGGSVEAGMRFGTYLADTTFYGGVFLTQKWFEKNNAPPAVSEYGKLPEFTDASFDLMINGIHSQPGLCLKIVPERTTYKGRLFILTNGVTASTCEPIVYGLKQRKRAVVVGERTAGAMLTGEYFKLRDGFSMMIPTADYYTSDGYRIDHKGVEPTIAVSQEKALDHVLQLLQDK